MTKTKMNTSEIRELLEEPELNYAKAIYSQLEEHMQGINRLARKFNETKSQSDLAILFWEIERTALRTEDLFNLGSSLLDKVDENNEAAVKKLHKLDKEGI